MKTKLGYGAVTLAVAAAIATQGCGWGVNGLDRMDEKYPKDAENDAVDVIGDAAADDAADQDVIEDTAVEDVANDDGTGDTVEGTDANVWPDVSYEGIEGVWAGRLVSNGAINVVLETLPMTTTDLFIAEAAGDVLTLTFCDEIIKVVPGEMISNTTETKPALRTAISKTPVSLSLSGDSVSTQKVIWKWALSESIGDDDPLPARNKDDDAANLANYPDIDDDTHPGVTIAVSVDMAGSVIEGERHMAKRVTYNLEEGSMSGDGRWITGSMTFQVEEVVLGADPTGPLENGATVEPSVEGTHYQFRRVEAAFDCAALVANHEGMFADAP